MSKQGQPDGQEFLGIRPHILSQRLELTSGFVHRLVELRIHEELAQRALAGIHLVENAVKFGYELVDAPGDLLILEKLAGGSLAGVEVCEQPVQLSHRLPEVVIQGW